MRLDRTTPVAFDASCRVAAAGSVTGGSSFLLALCEAGFLTGTVSSKALREAGRDVRAKLAPQALGRYRRILAGAKLRRVPVTATDERPFTSLVNTKDWHVLAGAVRASAPYLIALDRPFAAEVNRARLGVLALTPGQFIREFLPQHPDYRDLGR